ncbi:MAG TPA: membrane dipeptidase [Tepidisphaeraceae bacterium]|jgi:membrane dipeptidase
MNEIPIFDAHLDLAMNALAGRDITRPAAEQPLIGDEIATVGLPDLRRGNVHAVCGTIFCEPAGQNGGYRTPDEAFDIAEKQLRFYHNLHQQGLLAIPGLPHPGAAAMECRILIEGAACIRTPEDVAFFKSAGVEIVGLSWKATQHAGGTGEPGPLTDSGRSIVAALDELGIVHDVSHLAEESFWELIELAQGTVIASHSNCRSIVGDDPNERHLSDDMIRALAQRGGVIGINFFDKFLLPANEYKKRRATLNDVIAHIRRVCDLTGNTKQVGIGTDMDGGLGREQIPQEITDSADLPLLADALKAAGFNDADVRAILFDNWHRVLGPA